MFKPVRKRNRTGFTLIEILVVCAVLAILAGILLPLFSEAKKQTYRAQCVSNLLQFGHAFSLYSQDWAGYWPCPGGLKGNYTYWAQTGSGGLQGYLPQRGVKSVWCCPMVKGWNGQYSPRSYSMNSYLRTPADIEYPTCTSYIRGVDICKLTRPGKTILLYEGRYIANDSDKNLDYIYRCANWQYVSGYAQNTRLATVSDKPFHERLNNYLYCDGHVAARAPGLWFISSLSTYSEMYEWYVNKAAYEVMFTKYLAKSIPRN
ncbi:MAG: type II secretion system protein [Armatimonadota bacterium]|nr:type II secretion system GspH family protein [bacterium]